MDTSDVFNAARSEYGDHIALLVVAVCTINLTTKCKVKDYKDPGRYTARLKKKGEDHLWQEDDADVALAWSIGMVLYDYDLCRTFGKPGGGIGGCLPKTLKQLVAERAK
jgi:hypothetical protein